VSITDDDNVNIVLFDPDDNGFYRSRLQQWSALCPCMNSTEYRLLSILVDLCSERATYRKISLAEIATLLPTGKTDADGNPKPASKSTVANCIKALAALGQITGPNGEPISVSNKTKGDLRLAPRRLLRHACPASRNVYDALARARGATGDDGPRHPTGLNGLAQNSVPPSEPGHDRSPAAQNSVPPAQNSVLAGQNYVPAQVKAPATTSENRQGSISPFSTTSSTTHTRPRAREATSPDQPKTDTGVCVTPNDKEHLKEVLRTNLVHRAPASEQKTIGDGHKTAIRDLALRCLKAGATIDQIDTALSGAINDSTTHPYTHGTDALNALLARKQGKEDPLGTSQAPATAEVNSWVDDTNFEYPRLRPDQRACGGRECFDQGGKRYVSIEHPELGAFSCPTCKNAYKKEAAAA
jgi:hypothetical protein